VKYAVNARPEDETGRLTLCQIYLMSNKREAAIEMYNSVKSSDSGFARKVLDLISQRSVVTVSP